jgi:hypothetical protein
VQRWLSAFEFALNGADTEALAAPFHADSDSHLRDFLAFNTAHQDRQWWRCSGRCTAFNPSA